MFSFNIMLKAKRYELTGYYPSFKHFKKKKKKREDGWSGVMEGFIFFRQSLYIDRA